MTGGGDRAGPAVGDRTDFGHGRGPGPGAVFGPENPWLVRYGLAVATVWLLFLAFPGLAAWSEPISRGAKLAFTGLLVVFALLYTAGTRSTMVRERAREAAGEPGRWSAGAQPTVAPTEVGWFAAMLALATVAWFVAGVVALGMVTYLVSFAVFHFRWRTVWAVFFLGLAATVVLPVAVGRLADVWYLTLIVLGVGVGTIVIRAAEGVNLERAELRTRLAISDERSRVARDVHDVLGHSLTAVILKTELCQRLLAGVEAVGERDRATLERARVELDELGLISRQALTEIRATVVELRAPALADELAAAHTVLSDAGVGLVVAGDVADVPERHRPLLAWVVREAVTNIVRHARATRCHILLGPAPSSSASSSGAAAGPAGATVDGRAVLLRISDDGIGLDGQREGNGLRGLRERVEAVGGTLLVGSGSGLGSGTGTELTVLAAAAPTGPAPALRPDAAGVDGRVVRP